MLNLNLNTLLTRLRELPPEKTSIDYDYVMRTFVSSGFLEPEAFATMSIEANPYQPFTLYITGSDENGNVTSGSLTGIPVIVAISGSGEWPLTGSVTSQIFVTNNFGFNLTEQLTLSEAEDNLYLSGSIISASFAPSDRRPYVIFGSVTHTKGNIYNPDVNWVVRNISPVSDTLPVNGYTASASFVKDVNVPLFDINEVTSSISASFQYLYNLGVTASLEANVNNVTGSTTMSFQSVEKSINEAFTFFNPETETAFAMVAFLAENDLPHDFTASVEFNKGNLYNNNLNWLAFQSSTTEDLEGNGTNLNGVSSSFKIDKDIANIVDIAELTGSVDGTFTNEYSFNQTASLTQNVGNVTGSVTMSISVPELGINVVETFFNPSTSVATTTASFESISTDDYNITASVINNKGNESNADINYLSPAPNTFPNYIALTEATSSYELKKDIAVMVTGSALEEEDGTYKNNYSFNQTASLSSSYTKYVSFDLSSSVSAVSILEIPEVGVNIYSYDTASILTASFEAEVGDLDYNVTASFEFIADTTIEYVLIGGGGAGGYITQAGGGGGGGAGSIVTGSIKIQRGKPYSVNIGAGGPVTMEAPFVVGQGFNGEDSTFVGPLIPLENLYPSSSNSTFLIAKGGGAGGNQIGGPFNLIGNDGGSGGGGAGAGQAGRSCGDLQLAVGGLPTSASVLSTSSYDLEQLNPNSTGTAGSAANCFQGPGLRPFFAGGGTGGGKTTDINWVNINSGKLAGGGQYGYYVTATVNLIQPPTTRPNQSFGGGVWRDNNGNLSTLFVDGVAGTGGGGVGRRIDTDNNNLTFGPGLGGSGSMSIRYPGLPQALGGTIVYNEEGYTVHTFTASGEFTFSINPEPYTPTTSSFSVEYAAVGGGGAGGVTNGGGGGGAGQFLSGSFVVDLSTFDGIYTFEVGEGGLAQPVTTQLNRSFTASGDFGQPTIVLKGEETLLYAEGGAGGAGGVLSSSINAISASGGGAGSTFTASFGSGSTNGGEGIFLINTDFVGGFAAAGGGGGGHLQSGSNATSSVCFVNPLNDVITYRPIGGDGGAGIQLSIISSAPFVAGGGGGANSVIPQSCGSFNSAGGSGVGGSGAFFIIDNPNTFQADGGNGVKNTGSGGGGGIVDVGVNIPGKRAGNGGSGVTYIKFPNTINLPLFSGTPPVISEEGDFYIFKFISGTTLLKFI